MMENKLKIGLIEDDHALRDAMVRALADEARMEVVFAVPSAEEALREDLWGDIAVAVVDLDLPGASGIDLISTVHRRHPKLPLLVYTSLAEQESVFRALKAGACGYIVKTDGLHAMVAALRGAVAGRCSLSPVIAGWIIEDFRRSPHRDVEGVVEPLSPREETVLRLLAKGRIYKEIADDLSISVHTAHAHIRRIYSKFHARGRNETLRKARLSGYLPPAQG